MFVTFNTPAWSSVTMFGDVAVAMLKMMGHSGAVPGALLAADIPLALSRLKTEIAAAAGPEDGTPETDDEDDDGQPRVGLRQRAYPLIQLLAAAAEKNRDVMWVEGHPAV